MTYALLHLTEVVLPAIFPIVVHNTTDFMNHAPTILHQGTNFLVRNTKKIVQKYQKNCRYRLVSWYRIVGVFINPVVLCAAIGEILSRTHGGETDQTSAAFSAQRFLVASHSEKLAISIRARFFERSVFYSRDNLKRSWFLFASLPLCAAFSIREPFWKTRHLYSRAFLWAQYFLFARQSEKVEILYLHLFLCAQRFLVASHSEKLAISIRVPWFERSIFYSRTILKSSRSLFARLPLCAAFYIREVSWKACGLYLCVFLWAQRFLFPRQSEKVAISIRASSFVRNIFYSRGILQTSDLYSCAFLWAQCFLFARQSEKVEISIRASSFVNSVFYSRVILKNSQSLFTRLALRAAFSIRETIWKIAISIRASSFVRSVFYSRVVLKISQSLFARLSLSVAFSIRETIWTLAICIRALGCAFNNEYFDILIIQRSWVVVFFPFVYFKCNHVSARNTPREVV